MQGGGSCYAENECLARTLTDLGSSTGWDETQILRNNLLDDDPVINPDFYNWNHIYIRYCDGSCHTGTQSQPNEWGLFFAGHLTVMAVVDHATTNFGLGEASEVLVSGSSAGGIGAFVNADPISEKLPDACVKASPQAGWYYPDDLDNFQDWINGVRTPIRNQTVVWDRFLDEACVADNLDEPLRCGSISTLYPYIKTPIFMINNQYDSNQLFSQLGVPNDGSAETIDYVIYFGDRFRRSVIQVLNSSKNDGVYLTACMDHTGVTTSLQGMQINGVTYAQSLSDWYFERGQLPTQLLDLCGRLPCNPTPGCTTIGKGVRIDLPDVIGL
eukprot:TRINITY_DN576_c0_g1_i2.p1 TRINITY_DN576_c0_g1~~TRINITY_DN576_c0_g1_i2.p1  ORF type:complete len:328 (+),score=79.60 TRINITY_DN576_c0_g1_i2:307-1290(+)